MNNIDEKLKIVLSKEQKPPVSYDFMINNTLNNLRTKQRINFSRIRLYVATICCSLFLVTGVVFAKDIEQYFKSLFTNSTEAIDVAVENGYVQKEEMEYVYDNGIGVKVDNLVLDDLNLDISFKFETEKENIKSIHFKDFTITNDNEKVIYRTEFKYAETLDEVPLYNSFTWVNKPIKLTDTTFSDSILLGLREYEEFKEIYFDVTSIQLIYEDDSQEIVDGTWNFGVEISDEMRKSTNVEYKLVGKNEYIESATATLSATGMTLKLNLFESFDFGKYIENNIETMDDTGLIYINYNDEMLSPSQIGYGNIGEMQIVVNYDNISTYFNNIDKIEIYIKPFDTTITLENVK